MYLKYLKYILEHKKNVFKVCWSKGMYFHAFTHDLSKFRPSEFIPYAKYFYGNYPPQAALNNMTCINNKDKFKTKEDVKANFEKAWKLHYIRNNHHPEHWNGELIPHKHIREMVCDLEAMSLKFSGSAQEYYLKNYYKWHLNNDSRRSLEIELDLIKEYNAPICECNQEYWMTIGELIDDVDNHYKTYGKIRCGTPKNNLNDLLKPACDKYNLDIYELVTNSR